MMCWYPLLLLSDVLVACAECAWCHVLIVVQIAAGTMTLTDAASLLYMKAIR